MTVVKLIGVRRWRLANLIGYARVSTGDQSTDMQRDALAGLGYGPDEIASTLRELPTDGDSSDLLRQALQRLAVA